MKGDVRAGRTIGNIQFQGTVRDRLSSQKGRKKCYRIQARRKSSQVKHCTRVETDYINLNKRTSKEQLDGKGGQRLYYHRQRYACISMQASVLRSALKNFGVKTSKVGQWPKQGRIRRCLFTEVNTIKCINSLYQHLSFSLGTESSQAQLGDFFFLLFLKFQSKIFHMVKNMFLFMSITHPSFLSSLSLHQISCIHPQMKVSL